jgi:endonuclease/exonuclease/phosphatase family metal-dependent hydrolase
MRNKQTVLAILLLATLLFLPTIVEGKTGTGSEPATCLSPFSPADGEDFGPTPPLTSGEFKVLSFNIRYSRGNDGENSWRFRKDRVVDLIRREAPDFLGLQEAMIDPDPDYDQVGYIAERLPEYDMVVRSRNVDPTRDEACPIFYLRDRWELDGDRHGTYWLSDTPDVPGSKSWGNTIPRIATWAVFIEKETDRRVLIVNTHFDHQSEESRQRSAELVSRRSVGDGRRDLSENQITSDNAVIMGDFNCGESSPAVEKFHYDTHQNSSEEQLADDSYLTELTVNNRSSYNSGYLDTFRIAHPETPATSSGTFGGWTGRTSSDKIDYIFTNISFEVRDAAILHDNQEGRYPSDHYPVSAILRFSGQSYPILRDAYGNRFFDEADPDDESKPKSWELLGGSGQWHDGSSSDVGSALELTGDGEGSSQWINKTLRLEPGKLYYLSSWVQRLSGSGGCVPIGTSVHHRDYHPGEDMESLSHFFYAPEQSESAYLRLGQWEAEGTVRFGGLALYKALPIHERAGDIVLGHGEMIRNGRYQFQAAYNGEGSNYHRPLKTAQCGFNSNRWCFGANSHVTYEFTIPNLKLSPSELSINVTYHTSGTLTVETSMDGVAWDELATISEVGELKVDFPDETQEAGRILIRLKTQGAANLQVDRFTFNADLNEQLPDFVGRTKFTLYNEQYADVQVHSLTLEGSFDERILQIDGTTNRPDAELVGHAMARSTLPRRTHIGYRVSLNPTDELFTSRVALPHFPEKKAEDVGYSFDFRSGNYVRALAQGQIVPGWSIPPWGSFGFTPLATELHDDAYGYTICSKENGVVWSCEAERKVSRLRAPPLFAEYVERPDGWVPQTFRIHVKKDSSLRLSSARNESEAVQCVVHAKDEPIANLTAAVSDLTNRRGGVISSDEIDLLRVFYHWVENPTDAAGCTDYWPDALPPMDAERVDVAAGENQPIWILVHVPKDVPAGTYKGVVSLDSDGEFEAEVPIELTVWDFTLPDETTLETAFGLSYGNIDRYHGLKTEEEKRAVYELYQESFAEHRISPYDWTPLDHMRVQFDAESDPPSAELDMEAFVAEMQRVKETHHFNTFRLAPQGMGGGTFHDRYDPKIGEFGEESPEYQAMFSDYVSQLETHLDEAGLLDEAFVYWFDEPDPKDYEFVSDGFKRLEQYAPRLRRMITEEPNDGFLGAVPPIDIWCPVSHNFSEDAANARMDLGERFWWYVCCGPKTPHAGLFIDHPATELRVWTWQAWQRGITGELVWQSNYWHSNTAFPDTWQDPYEDPMGYVSGYSTPSGTKRFWGNGDGRFIYPPLAARTPGVSGDEPVLEGPVSSIRWEMLREGIEDYEYLSMLKRLIEERRDELSTADVERYEGLLEMAPAISESMTSFTKTPDPIMRRRRELAEAIVELNR